MSHVTLQLTTREAEILLDLLRDRVEEVDAELEHCQDDPSALALLVEPGETPPTIEDLEEYRDELLTLVERMPLEDLEIEED